MKYQRQPVLDPKQAALITRARKLTAELARAQDRREALVESMLEAGLSYRLIADATGYSRTAIADRARAMREAETGGKAA